MKHPTSVNELAEVTAWKARMNALQENMARRAPHIKRLEDQKKLLQELSEQKITNPQEAKINKRKKWAMMAAIARTESALKLL